MLVAKRFLDEKGPEDIHQFVRDHQRSKRGKLMSMSSIYFMQRGSGVLEARGLDCYHPPRHEVAMKTWQGRDARVARKMRFVPRPKHIPEGMKSILQPKREYPNPTVPKQAQSMLSWAWLVELFTRPVEERTDLLQSWWSRLAPQHYLITNRDRSRFRLCLHAGNFGCIAIIAQPKNDTLWRFEPRKGMVRLVHICDIRDSDVCPVAPVAVIGEGILIRQTSPFECFLVFERGWVPHQAQR